MSGTPYGYSSQDSNANVGRNTTDPSGIQSPNEDGGALPPSSGQQRISSGSWLTFWIAVVVVVLVGIAWWLVATAGGESPAGIPNAAAYATAVLGTT